ncbi:hypothetical protein A2Z33_01520 [Candidatus Gottesmanbacteria bacterium RBG_16_52_11]|uniref:TrpR-like protein YerC/YecD n=1 Tax=Candidatus Gottesmanbacteria bacterium RBG_16_52_11 TaxID=1798374 RepID=A0A1F5YNX0_9BACT|nr:MAG: hypothetical protein A2Z33_01520 [Candidatus Gottesmanbacteria bacterium RBG_16_52_11]
MSQVSNYPVNKDIFYEIRDEFLWVLADLRNADDVKAFYSDFFTKTERIMFAKRLAIAFMIRQGMKYDDIRRVLHVSTSTISAVAAWMEKGGDGVKRVIDRLSAEHKMLQFWKKVRREVVEYFINPRMTHETR